MTKTPPQKAGEITGAEPEKGEAPAPNVDASKTTSAQTPIEDNDDAISRAAEEGRLKRKFARYAAPLVVVINGRCYKALDWSLGGFRINNARDLGLAGERVTAKILVKYDGFALSFVTSAELVRLDPASREAAFRFTELSDEQIRLLSYFSSAFLAGRMQSIDGVLRHMRPEHGDASEIAQDSDEAKASRRRALVRRSVLVVAAVAALFTARMSFLQMVSVSAATAWIDTPMVTLSAPDAAIMISAEVAEGDFVNRGDAIAQLVDSKLNAEIAYAQAERDQLAGKLGALRQSLDERAAVLEAEIHAAEAARDRARERRANAADAVEAARNVTNAHHSLAAPEYVSLTELNAAERARTEAEDSLALADAAVDQAQSRLDTAAAGYFYGDARSTGNDPAVLSAEIAELKRVIDAEDVRIKGLRARQAEFALVSPCRCQIVDFAALPGERVSPVSPIVRLHRVDGAAQVAAFLRHRDARNLEIGSRATVRLADGRVDTNARIISVRANVRLANESRLLNRDLNPGKFSEVTVRLSQGFENAPVAGAEVTMVWSVFGWLERAFYFSV